VRSYSAIIPKLQLTAEQQSTGHGTTDWFQIGKGVRQSCISDSFTWAAIPSLGLEQAWVPLLDWSVVKTAWHGALH